VHSLPAREASRDDLRHLLGHEGPVDAVETVVANETDLLGAVGTSPNKGLEVADLDRTERERQRK
jgi:hypothetical protein